ncbi:hypothetical protein LTR36_007969 [Oleoguttula mirabilis]|uniref:NAD(P)-binding protein n=1 Tax=Oleoguttula mirabilis TaxID=1507867 RepID=A0AAV9J9R8_9PEZI|nr:hypothetical protein LTR36_007969 [Oleoguttula mirabilis]
MADMESWGFGKFGEFISKTHTEPYEATDPSKVRLPQPFVVCIVGASRGIGAGVAKSYAKAGATGLILAARRVSGLEETAAQCKKINPKVDIEIVPCDITKVEDVANLADKTKAKFGGRLDVVVVNSGVSGPIETKVTTIDPKDFQNAINVNYVGTFLSAKYLIPLLLSTEGGAKAFLAVSTFATMILRGPFASPTYSVSKAAQLKLVENVHEEFVGEGLAAFSVHPGAVWTEMNSDHAPEAFKPFFGDSPDLCGAFCVWLTKDGSQRHWLSGRLVSATYDVEELETKKDEIVEKDLLKFRLAY